MTPAPAITTAFECLECVVGWGYDVYSWRDSERRYNVNVTRPGTGFVIHGDPHEYFSDAVMSAYHGVVQHIKEERNAARENPGVKERVTPE